MPPIAAASQHVDTQQRHRARVIYHNGLLEIHADNSSLNQILRDISRQTGMRITGGVVDQRVFGSYGPAPAATILETLLDPTNTNMLLEETQTHDPKQLVLTPRAGGVSPPGPSSPSYDAFEDEPELPPTGSAPAGIPTTAAAAGTAVGSTGTAPSTPPGRPELGNVLGNPNNVSPSASTLPVTNSVPISTLPTPSTATPVSGIVDAPNPPPGSSTTGGFTSQTPNTNPNTAPSATGTQSSPAGVKTPQQIYEELRQLEQQKGNQQANPQGSSAPQ